MNDFYKFPNPNMANFKCRICKTSADMPIYLVPIPGTEWGRTSRAEQIHVECYELFSKMFAIEKSQLDKTEG